MLLPPLRKTIQLPPLSWRKKTAGQHFPQQRTVRPMSLRALSPLKFSQRKLFPLNLSRLNLSRLNLSRLNLSPLNVSALKLSCRQLSETEAWTKAAFPGEGLRRGAGPGLLCWLLLSAGAASAATVVAVDDGNTLRVREGESVITLRLACLEAPPLGQDPHGAKARAALLRLAPVGSVVSVAPLARVGPGAAMAEITRGGANINVEMVRSGQAFAALSQGSACDPLRYAEAENTAQFRRLGVWQVAGGLQRPESWRRANQEEVERKRREKEARERMAQRTPPVSPGAVPSTSPRARAAAGPPSGQSVMSYKQCVSANRQSFMRTTSGIAPPKGLFEEICGCFLKPQAMEDPRALFERCFIKTAQRFGLPV